MTVAAPLVICLVSQTRLTASHTTLLSQSQPIVALARNLKHITVCIICMAGHVSVSLSALLSTPTAGWCNIYKVQLIPQPAAAWQPN